jgi:hypothetical protein
MKNLFRAAGVFAALGCTAVKADAYELVGTWTGIGRNANGAGIYRDIFQFNSDGTFAELFGVGALPGYTGNGAVQCQGTYQFDGRYLVVQKYCPTLPPIGGRFAAPVIFESAFAMTWGDTRFIRQE